MNFALFMVYELKFMTDQILCTSNEFLKQFMMVHGHSWTLSTFKPLLSVPTKTAKTVELSVSSGPFKVQSEGTRKPGKQLSSRTFNGVCRAMNHKATQSAFSCSYPTPATTAACFPATWSFSSGWKIS